MRSTRRLLLVLVAALAVMVPAGVAGAATTTTDHGVFTGVTWDTCTPSQPTAQASGTWSFAEHKDTGTLAVNIFLDGRHHVAFGGTLPLVTVPGADWAVRLETAAGTLTVSLTGDQLSYDIPGYTDPFGGNFRCSDVTYHGVAR